MGAAKPLAAALHQTQHRLHELYAERAEDWRRDHLGASVVGHECLRYLWLTFRWAMPGNLEGDGRMQRLLERGKREEAWIVADLKAIGIEVWNVDEETGEQFRISWGHVGGGVDGVVKGLLEAPKTPHVLEVKTSNAKRFAYLKSKGVERANKRHWIQMQVYMLGLGLERAFYVVVCKDNDELYTERVYLDRDAAQAAVDRAQDVVAMDAPPPAKAPAFPPCMLTSKDGTQWPCDYFELCHGARLPEKNCRTCVSSTPRPDGTWHCEHQDEELTPDDQRDHFDCHMTMPQMVCPGAVQVLELDEEKRVITFARHNGEVIE
ncbi:MAG: oxidoreductase [Planctomycetes bacterium]|nr:oxidoreductase [Planctomycetota bacterium]